MFVGEFGEFVGGDVFGNAAGRVGCVIIASGAVDDFWGITKGVGDCFDGVFIGVDDGAVDVVADGGAAEAGSSSKGRLVPIPICYFCF